jgi:hypothetical protein
VENIARALKVFVIAGGVVLLAGTVLLVVLIVMRASENRADPPESPRAENPGGQLESPRAESFAGAGVELPAPRLCEAALPVPARSGELPAVPQNVPLPAGARIEQVVLGAGCLILLGVDGAGRQFVALVDPFTGARLSLLLIRPEE